MKKLIFPLLILVVVGGLVFFFHKDTSRSVSENTKIQIQKNFGKIPLYFEKNEGQAGDEIDFISRGQGYGFSIKPTESFLQISDDLLKMKLKGANAKAKGDGIDKQVAKINYLTGNDSKKWKTGISTYSKVKYDNVYSGIDLVYYGNQKKLEYDFVVAPNTDYSQIALQFEGAEKIAINDKGDLVLTIAEGKELVQEKPKIYQEIDQEKKIIDGSYVLKGKDEVGFVVAAYDSTKPLVIDPTLVFSTYFGGDASDSSDDVAIDSSGNIFVTGRTYSTNFPTVNAYQGTSDGQSDVFVSKFSADGQTLIFSTYLGGDGPDSASGITVDSLGGILVTGWTESLNFPTVNAYQVTSGGAYDTFISKFSADGQALIFSTYFGGDSGDESSNVAVDPSGNILVTGSTYSTNFPTVNAYQGTNSGSTDGFVSKFSADGQALIFSTYLGGDGPDSASGITVDSWGGTLVTGWTGSANFPTVDAYQEVRNGPRDAFVSKFGSDGQTLIFSTHLGGSDDDEAYEIALDSSGDVLVTGNTYSSNFPTVNAYQASFGGGLNDAFVSKFSADGQTLIFSTYLGGENFDRAYGITIDSWGSIFVTGQTKSIYFPTMNAYQETRDGLSDAFISKFSTDGQTLTFSTYLGGSGHDRAHAIAVDSLGGILVTGWTESLNFPTVNAYQASLGDSYGDAFITKFSLKSISFGPASIPPSLEDNLPEDNLPLLAEVCDGIDNDGDGQIDEGFMWFGKNCVEIKTMSPEMLHKMKERLMQEDSKQKNPKKKELLKKKK